ncbi:MAG: glutaredoxin, partial [Bacteriovoracaceae bacterium]
SDGATVFTKVGCPHCKAAKELLTAKGIKITEVPGLKTYALKAMGGSGTYPLVFLDGKLVGGNTELTALLK